MQGQNINSGQSQSEQSKFQNMFSIPVSLAYINGTQIASQSGQFIKLNVRYASFRRTPLVRFMLAMPGQQPQMVFNLTDTDIPNFLEQLVNARYSLEVNYALKLVHLAEQLKQSNQKQTKLNETFFSFSNRFGDTIQLGYASAISLIQKGEQNEIKYQDYLIMLASGVNGQFAFYMPNVLGMLELLRLAIETVGTMVYLNRSGYVHGQQAGQIQRRGQSRAFNQSQQFNQFPNQSNQPTQLTQQNPPTSISNAIVDDLDSFLD